MFDPLSSTADIFASDGKTDDSMPPWPTTPHTPNSPIPNLRRASTPNPSTPDKGPSPGLYGKEPQIYGAPEPGLISPRETVGSNGTKYEKAGPYLRVRLTGLDRNRRDILIKFDAQTNLSNFTGTTYRNVSRSYVEFQQFYEAIAYSNPQTIVPALPLPQTSAPTDEEDDRLVKIMLQRWLTRICENPILIQDEELRSFIESDFGYQPTPRPRRRAGSSFGIMRRGVPDEDEELQRARFELTKLETQYFDAAKAIDKLALARKSLAMAQIEMGNKLVNVATTESHPPLGNALRKLGRTWHSLADLGQAQAISECVVVADSLGYQGMNSRSAKETLQQRTGVLEEYQAAVKSTISKRRNIERLKASSNIRPEKVDEAIEDMEEANKYEQVLARRAEGISQNLHSALLVHNRLVTADVNTALIEHARSTIMYERQFLRELEALMPDVNTAASKVIVNKTNGAPRPSIIPPLEDDTRPTADLQTRTASSLPGTKPSTPVPITTSFAPPRTPQNQSFASQAQLPPIPSISVQQQRPTSQTPVAGPSTPTRASTPAVDPLLGMQSPGAGPSSGLSTAPTSPQVLHSLLHKDEPPLGGRFVDGTRSMFIQPTSPLHSPSLSSSSHTPTTPSTASSAGYRAAQAGQFNTLGRTGSSPLAASTFATSSGGAAAYDPLSVPRGTMMAPGHAPAPPAAGGALDPLGQARPTYMSQTVRVQPTRPRLDPREAASKLANMF